MGINESGRKKLTIVKAFEPKTPEGFRSPVLEFTAKIEGDDSIIKHSTWTGSLFPYIKADTTIDCDVEVKPGKADNEGNPRFNRKVTQIYVDGKPVAEQKTFQKGGGYQHQTSDAELKAKAKNTALMQAVDWVKFLLDKTDGKANEFDPIPCAERFYQWLIKDTIPPIKPSPEGSKTVASAAEPPPKVEAPPAKDVKAEGVGKIPITAKEVCDSVNRAIRENLWSPDQVGKVIIALGGKGIGTWQAVKSLTPDKLAELNKAVQEALKPANLKAVRVKEGC